MGHGEEVGRQGVRSDTATAATLFEIVSCPRESASQMIGSVMYFGHTSLVRGFLATLLLSVGAVVAAHSAEPAAAPARKDKIYYFEHRLLPRLTHQTQGEFYADLRKGDVQKFEDMARRMVDFEFAANLSIHPATDLEGVVLTFPRPTEPVHCYWVAIVRDGAGFRYFTYEMDEDIMSVGIKGSVCEWTPAGSHKNYGATKEADEASFLKEVKKVLQAPVKAE